MMEKEPTTEQPPKKRKVNRTFNSYMIPRHVHEWNKNQSTHSRVENWKKGGGIPQK